MLNAIFLKKRLKLSDHINYNQTNCDAKKTNIILD